MLNWKDTTKGEAGGPRVLHITNGCINVMVRQYVGCGDTRYLTIKEFDIKRVDIGDVNKEAAKARAMLLLQGLVQKQISMLQEIEESLYINEAY